MLIRKDDKSFTGGPLDVLCILHRIETDTFHAAYFEEKMMPGPIVQVSAVATVRLMSHMHHTEGAESFAGAQEHLKDLATKIELPETNIVRDRAIPWDGYPFILMVPNWRQKELPVSAVLPQPE